MICIIPQHGGSNRLPGKAFRSFCGRPLVAWAVAQAVQAKCIDKVYVSTESIGIADICEPLGAEIIWRPHEVTDKRFSASVPLLHAMHAIGKPALEGPTIHMLAMTPLKKPGDIDRMYETYMSAPDVPRGMTKSVRLAAPLQEALLFKRHTPVNGTPRARCTYCSKVDMMAAVGGCNVKDAAAIEESLQRVAWGHGTDTGNITDAAVDDDYLVGLGTAGESIFYYTPCELWQTHEIDDIAGFELCEMLMNQFILKGKSMEEVYAE
jgi:GTP:adenosylcobinamide-phosphate guanylyltransferase